MFKDTYPDSNSSRFSQQAQINALNERVAALEGGSVVLPGDAWGVQPFNANDPRINWHSFNPDEFDRLPTYQQQIRYLASVMQGSSGATVTDVTIDGDGHLIVTLSNGQVLDAGVAKGDPGEDSTVPGPEGDSAYEVAVANGFVGTEVQWLSSLVGPPSTVPGPANSLTIGTVEEGPAGASITGTPPAQVLNLTLPKGDPGDDSTVPGPAGDSAYEVAVTNGFVGTEAQWLDSLKGADGEDGDDSTVPGPPGDSAYEVAVENGFEGTEGEWLDSLKGAPGEDSTVPGPANSLTIGTVEEGPAGASITGTPPAQVLNLTLPKGDPGDDSTVPGPPGPPNSLSIGTVEEGEAASADITGTAPLQILSLTLPKGSDGDDGSDGDSAYEVAVANGFVGTEEEWLESLKGDPGQDSTVPGPPGDSAYEVAVENGFEGTESQWLESLVGPKGDKGDDGSVSALWSGLDVVPSLVSAVAEHKGSIGSVSNVVVSPPVVVQRESDAAGEVDISAEVSWDGTGAPTVEIFWYISNSDTASFDLLAGVTRQDPSVTGSDLRLYPNTPTIGEGPYGIGGQYTLEYSRPLVTNPATFRLVVRYLKVGS